MSTATETVRDLNPGVNKAQWIAAAKPLVAACVAQMHLAVETCKETGKENPPEFLLEAVAKVAEMEASPHALLSYTRMARTAINVIAEQLGTLRVDNHPRWQHLTATFLENLEAFELAWRGIDALKAQLAPDNMPEAQPPETELDSPEYNAAAKRYADGALNLMRLVGKAAKASDDRTFQALPLLEEFLATQTKIPLKRLKAIQEMTIPSAVSLTFSIAKLLHDDHPEAQTLAAAFWDRMQDLESADRALGAL